MDLANLLPAGGLGAVGVGGLLVMVVTVEHTYDQYGPRRPRERPRGVEDDL